MSLEVEAGKAKVRYIGFIHLGLSPKLASLLIVILVVSCFGPYVTIFGYGVRFEQVLLYGLVVILVPFSVGRLGLNSTAKAALIILILQFAIACIAMLLVNRPEGFPPASVQAQIDSFTMPVVAILVVASIARPLILMSALLRVASRALVVMTALNVLVASFQSQFSGKSLLPIFWSADPTGWTVGEQAQLGMRYSGIFNQPAEAGFVYGIALVALVFACRFRYALSLALAAIIVVGGLLSASKVFYACVFVIFLYGIVSALRHHRIMKSSLAFLVVTTTSLGFFAVSGFLPDRLERLNVSQAVSSSADSGAGIAIISTIPSVANTFTAGRIGTDGSFEQIAPQVLTNSPIVGFGFGGWQTAYDSSWMESLVIGGLLGSLMLVLVFFLLFRQGLIMLKGPTHSAMLIVLTACALLGSFGVGVLTANRVSTIFWIIVTLLAFGRLEYSERVMGLMNHDRQFCKNHNCSEVSGSQ